MSTKKRAGKHKKSSLLSRWQLCIDLGLLTKAPPECKVVFRTLRSSLGQKANTNIAREPAGLAGIFNSVQSVWARPTVTKVAKQNKQRSEILGWTNCLWHQRNNSVKQMLMEHKSIAAACAIPTLITQLLYAIYARVPECTLNSTATIEAGKQGCGIDARCAAILYQITCCVLFLETFSARVLECILSSSAMIEHW